MVSQTYTPPTCTLKVTTIGSPILAKLGRPRRQEFELNLDDPKLPEERHFTIKGDRSQLDALYEAVNSYVREFLKKDRVARPGKFSDSDVADAERQDKDKNPSIATPNDSSILETSDRLDNPYSRQARTGIYLRSRDLLTHELFLGTLATEKTGATISLSALHLFDLLVALEQWQKEAIAVPYLPATEEPTPTPAWLRSLALIFVTAGLTVLGVRLYDRYVIARQNDAKIAGKDFSGIDEQLESLLSPVTPTVAPSPTLIPTPIALPTPPAGELPGVKPPPIDVPVLFPSPVPTPSSPTFSFPPPTSTRTSTTPGTNVVILPQIPAPIPPQRPVFPAPALPDTSVPLEPRSPRPPASSIAPPPIPPGGYPRNVPQISRNGVKPYVDVTRIPLRVPNAIALPALDDTNVALAPRSDRAEEAERQKVVKSDRSLFDKIPQVAEIRKHFEETWEPPEDLDRSLQYSLVLNDDGSIKRVIPIGQASVDFYELTNMPFEEEPFVSGIEEGKSATVRLVLRTNGKVQTFLESMN